MSTFGLFPATTNVKTSSIDFNSFNMPRPPPIGYFNEDRKIGPVTLPEQKITKAQHVDRIKNACVKTGDTQWKCAYLEGIIYRNKSYTGNIGGRGYTGYIDGIGDLGDTEIIDALDSNSSGDGSLVDDYKNAPCDLVNILINLGYTKDTFIKPTDNNGDDLDISVTDDKYDQYTKRLLSGTSVSLYLKKNMIDSEQSLYNACQLAVVQSKQYSVKDLIGYSIHYNITDIFKAFPGQSLLLIIMLIISVYLLSAGTMASADVGYAITYIITSRSNSTSPFYWVGLFLGLLIPAGLLVYHITNLITTSYKRLSEVTVKDVTLDPYGASQNVEELKKGRFTDIGLITLLIFLIYVVVGFIFWIISSKISKESKMLGVFVLLLILSAMIYVLYYIAPVLSSESGELKAVSEDLKVYTNADGTNASVMTNAFVESNIRYSLFLYSVAAIVITAFYLRSTKASIASTNVLESIKEGFMSSFAILALPIIWVINWMIGVNFFIIYPFVIMIARYLRYFLYYSMRQRFLADPKLYDTHPSIKEEFDHPETYQAPWDLLGVTIMKYMMKMNGTRAEYSEMIVDKRDGMKNVAGNGYVTGHFLRLMARAPDSTQDPNIGYAYQGTVTFITFVATLIVLYGVVGSKNIPYLQLSSNVNIYNLPESAADEASLG